MTLTSQANAVQSQLEGMNQPSAAISNYLATTAAPSVDGFFDYIASLIHQVELFREQSAILREDLRVPKGIHSSPRGRKSKGAIRTEMNLSESARELALSLGGSSGMVGGVERLFSMLPLFNQYRSILEIIAEKPEQAIALQDQIKAMLSSE